MVSLAPVLVVFSPIALPFSSATFLVTIMRLLHVCRTAVIRSANTVATTFAVASKQIHFSLDVSYRECMFTLAMIKPCFALARIALDTIWRPPHRLGAGRDKMNSTVPPRVFFYQLLCLLNTLLERDTFKVLRRHH